MKKDDPQNHPVFVLLIGLAAVVFLLVGGSATDLLDDSTLGCAVAIIATLYVVISGLASDRVPSNLIQWNHDRTRSSQTREFYTGGCPRKSSLDTRFDTRYR